MSRSRLVRVASWLRYGGRAARLLGALALSAGAFMLLAAPAGGQPEFLTNIHPGWDPQSRQFEIRHFVSFAAATAGEHAGFTIETTIEISDTDVNLLVRLGPVVSPVEPVEGASREREVPLQPVLIPWEPGELSGQKTAVITAVLKNPAGHSMIEHEVVVLIDLDN